MIYYILRPIVKWTLKLYFRKIYLSGIENIPKDKAIIFASNHPSAFIEPCLLACFLPMQLHFLVRGDLFSLRWLSWLLKGTNQIPIFRQKDGVENVKKNLITQEMVRELFAKNKAVLMFPEAHTHENIYLKPLKKGIARFAFMDHGADCYIVPVGVNFDKNIPFNSKVSVIIGDPLRVNDYKGKTEITPAKRMNLLLADLTTAMKESLRHIDIEEKEEVVQKVYRLLDNERPVTAIPFQSDDRSVFEEEKKIARALDKEESKYKSVQHFLSTINVRKAEKPSFIDLFFMVLLLPLFLFGFILHFIPDRIAKAVVLKKVTLHEFRAPVYIALLVFQYIFIFAILLLFLIIYGKKVLFLISLFILSGLISILYLKMWGNKFKYVFRPKSHHEVASKLHKIISE
jgi:1-acyl-sn-glycerol-3-phosphate acyltransferase